MFYYRLQTKFAKVMFLQVSVCPQGGRVWHVVGGDVRGRGACMVGGVCGGGMHGRGVCMAEGCAWQGGMCGEGHAWQGVCVAGGVCMAGRHTWLGVCMAGGCVWWWGGAGMHGRGPWGACMAGHMHGRGRAFMPQQILGDMVNERAVRILLECTLVVYRMEFDQRR